MLNPSVQKASRAFYKSVPLDARAQEYLDLINKPRTRDTVEYALKAFYAFRLRGSPAPLAWKDMEFDVLVKFDKWLVRHKYKPMSRRTYYTCVVEYLRYGIDKEWLSPRFSLERAQYRGKKAHKGDTYPIPNIPPALPRVIAYYDNLLLPKGDDAITKWQRLGILRGRAIVHTLYASAGRVSEVAGLRRKDVQDGRRKEIKIVGKGDKERFLYLTAEALEAIARYVDERGDTHEPLFIRHNKGYGQSISRSMFWKIVHFAGEQYGLEVSPHDFRHFRARQMLDAGVPLEAIQDILGHKDIGTTRRVYAHYSKPAIRAIFDGATLTPSAALEKWRAEEKGEWR